MRKRPTTNPPPAIATQSADSQAAGEPQQRQPTKLFLLVTVPESIGFFDGGMKALKQAGFLPTVVTSPGPELARNFPS